MQLIIRDLIYRSPLKLNPFPKQSISNFYLLKSFELKVMVIGLIFF